MSACRTTARATRPRSRRSPRTSSAIDPDQISIRYGDTATSPFGFGTFASRTIVFAGGAVAKSCRVMLREKIKHIGAHLLQTDVAERADRGRRGASGRPAQCQLRRNRARRQRAAGTAAGRHGAAARERPAPTSRSETGGVFSYGTHAVVVAVDPDTGVVEILDYAVAEDCGTMINPMIVDGQVQGGIAQGIGTALFEEIPYRRDRPAARHHLRRLHDALRDRNPDGARSRTSVTPALATEYGVKGVGEGGAIAPPAAIANAVADAFRDIGASFNETPLTPRRVSEAVAAARHAKVAALMKPAPFEYVRPASLAEAIGALASAERERQPLAGGQSLLPLLATAHDHRRASGRHRPARRSHGGGRDRPTCRDRRGDHACRDRGRARARSGPRA